ncbi:TPA: hypothetical protein L5697_002087 [Pseudomonas aeruginosa]|nr:hypothetical protein [Pseudomonas aeruginosa]
MPPCCRRANWRSCSRPSERCVTRGRLRAASSFLAPEMGPSSSRNRT